MSWQMKGNIVVVGGTAVVEGNVMLVNKGDVGEPKSIIPGLLKENLMMKKRRAWTLMEKPILLTEYGVAMEVGSENETTSPALLDDEINLLDAIELPEVEKLANAADQSVVVGENGSN
ncbi:hypothetical protein C1H46_035262 [Malus baccata]|uniref:Uncharacterized protein n=1 Tax=Malus baccata TaxID=106549 RepID=A0A540KYB4_MALBA|nr:hypothetical protein C1H46_035262 [Malus baccata]